MSSPDGSLHILDGTVDDDHRWLQALAATLIEHFKFSSSTSAYSLIDDTSRKLNKLSGNDESLRQLEGAKDSQRSACYQLQMSINC